jgi:hypothetical protein
MEKRTLIKWDVPHYGDGDGIVDVTIKVSPDVWNGKSKDDHIFFWMPEEDYHVGYHNSVDGWTILQVAEEVSGKWHLTRPVLGLNDEHVVICFDYCDTRSDYSLAVIQYVELYNGAIEPFFHVTDKRAAVYSIAAKEILSDSSYVEINVPGGWGATIAWLPIHRVK